MTWRTGIAALSSALLLASAQSQRILRELPFTSALAELQKHTGPLADAEALLLKLLNEPKRPVAAAPAAPPPLTLRRRGETLVAIGPPDDVARIERMMAQVARTDPQVATLQCSILEMPEAVAKAQQLQAGSTPIDEVAAGKLLKAVVQARGTLLNLPEVKLLPLVPFATAPKLAADAKPTWRITGEGLLLADNEVRVDCQLRADRPTLLPNWRTQVQNGKGALFVQPDGDRTIAVWIRCVAITPYKPTPKAATAAMPAPTSGK